MTDDPSTDPPKISSDPPKISSDPSKISSDPPKISSDPPKISSIPTVKLCRMTSDKSSDNNLCEFFTPQQCEIIKKYTGGDDFYTRKVGEEATFLDVDHVERVFSLMSIRREKMIKSRVEQCEAKQCRAKQRRAEQRRAKQRRGKRRGAKQRRRRIMVGAKVTERRKIQQLH